MDLRRSQEGFTLVEIMIVVVIIGLLAAMALPWMQKARQLSQDKAVLNNLRVLSGAADQYFLEYGVSTVASTSLIGSNPSNYIHSFQTVAIETYQSTITQGLGVSASGIAGSRTVSFTN